MKSQFSKSSSSSSISESSESGVTFSNDDPTPKKSSIFGISVINDL
jgi:hypothetical protein